MHKYFAHKIEAYTRACRGTQINWLQGGEGGNIYINICLYPYQSIISHVYMGERRIFPLHTCARRQYIGGEIAQIHKVGKFPPLAS